MKDWFTVEKIDNNTFAISEYKHWEETHCYLLCGNEKAILIDTGLGVENIKEITDSLTKLPIMVMNYPCSSGTTLEVTSSLTILQSMKLKRIG